MIIPGRRFTGYYESLEYPVDVLEMTGDGIAFVADRQELEYLAWTGQVYGVGNRNRLKRIRLQEPCEPPPVVTQSRLGGTSYVYQERIGPAHAIWQFRSVHAGEGLGVVNECLVMEMEIAG